MNIEAFIDQHCMGCITPASAGSYNKHLEITSENYFASTHVLFEAFYFRTRPGNGKHSARELPIYGSSEVDSRQTLDCLGPARATSKPYWRHNGSAGY
jgi:hypothetical protein